MSNDDFDVYLDIGEQAAGRHDFDDEIPNRAEISSANLQKLEGLRDAVVGAIRENRGIQPHELDPYISCWRGPRPDLRKIFYRDQLEWLLREYVTTVEAHGFFETTNVLGFVIECGYKDELSESEERQPLQLRTTPIHQAVRCNLPRVIPDLFRIYDNVNVDYSDRHGLTHFHAACMAGCRAAVENLLWLFLMLPRESTRLDSPLHYALIGGQLGVAELLLRRGVVEPNQADPRGLTPLHLICARHQDKGLLRWFLKICDDIRRKVRIDAQDKSGDTPLHMALRLGHKTAMELLLKRGADPNLANHDGETPLHTICGWRWYHSHDDDDEDDDGLQLFFKIGSEINRPIEVNRPDNKGRTALEIAVAHLWPDQVEILLNHGADPLLSRCFRFPDEQDRLGERFDPKNYPWDFSKLKLASLVLVIVELLEDRGYRLSLEDTWTIIILFAKHEIIDRKKSMELKRCWRDDERSLIEAKKMTIGSNCLSLYDLTRLPIEEAEKRLTREDYLDFARSNKLMRLSEATREACDAHLCEKLTARFYRLRIQLAGT